MSPSYDEGYKARMDGKPISADPYAKHWCPYKSPNWRQGWRDAAKDAKKETKTTKRRRHD